MPEPLYALGNEIGNARSGAEIDEPEKRIDDILKAELARNANGEAPIAVRWPPWPGRATASSFDAAAANGASRLA